MTRPSKPVVQRSAVVVVAILLALAIARQLDLSAQITMLLGLALIVATIGLMMKFGKP
jgi:hypothetical protein